MPTLFTFPVFINKVLRGRRQENIFLISLFLDSCTLGSGLMFCYLTHEQFTYEDFTVFQTYLFLDSQNALHLMLNVMTHSDSLQ